MGVDFTPILVVGWPIESEQIVKHSGLDKDPEDYFEDHIEAFEDLFNSTIVHIKESGSRCYGGYHKYWLCVNVGKFTVEEFSFNVLLTFVKDVADKARELGIALEGPPEVHAEILVH